MSVTWFGATVTVEVGFASNPTVALGSTTWTDISAYVRAVSTHRGRSTELDTFQAGTATFVLKNEDRRFDPNYTAGPYYPNVLPMRRIRVKVAHNAVTYDVWSGFVNDWPQEYDIGGKYGEVTLTATDAFKPFALMRLPESAYAVDLQTGGSGGLFPDVWYRLGEESGTVAVDSSGNGEDGTYVGGATFNATGGLIFGGTDGAINFDGVDDQVTCPFPVTAFPVTIECWVSVPDTIVGQTLFSQDWLLTGVASRYMRIAIINGFVDAQLSDGGNSCQSVSDIDLRDGRPHHVVVTFNDGTSAPSINVDTLASYSVFTVTGTSTLPPAPFFTIGGVGGDSVVIDEFALYRGKSYSIWGGNFAQHYHFGFDPWDGDTSGARIGRLLDLMGWPAADRTIATGISTLQSVALGEQPLLTVLQDVEASEQGQLYIDDDGKVVFRDRHWRFEDALATDSNATFGDSGAELPYADIVTDGGEQYITNHVRARRQGGGAIDVTDATSITTFYERIDELSGLQNSSDLEIRDLANWRLASRKNPIQRVAQLTVFPRRPVSATSILLFAQVLGRSIGERLTVKRRPQGVGTALTYTVLVEGVDHSFTFEGDWSTRWYLSSFDSLATVQPLILDDAVYGILDTNVLAY
jgi:hypothetical protein